MAKKTRYGQKEQEQAWLNAEVDTLYRQAARHRGDEPGVEEAAEEWRESQR
jgi:hypothetical protein